MKTVREYLTEDEQKRCEAGDNSLFDIAMARQIAEEKRDEGWASFWFAVVVMPPFIGMMWLLDRLI